MSDWYEIQGFVSPGEYERFVEYLQEQVSSGKAEEVPADPSYGPGELFGGRWYRSLATGEVWRLVPPDPPFTGLWERVRAARNVTVAATSLALDYGVRDAFDLDGRVIVLIDPDAYLHDPEHEQARRRGDNPIRNLRAYAADGELLWEAEFPEAVDYYYRIVSRQPLVVLSFSSYRCRIDPETGRITEAEFTK